MLVADRLIAVSEDRPGIIQSLAAQLVFDSKISRLAMIGDLLKSFEVGLELEGINKAMSCSSGLGGLQNDGEAIPTGGDQRRGQRGSGCCGHGGSPVFC